MTGQGSRNLVTQRIKEGSINCRQQKGFIQRERNSTGQSAAGDQGTGGSGEVAQELVMSRTSLMGPVGRSYSCQGRGLVVLDLTPRHAWTIHPIVLIICLPNHMQP